MKAHVISLETERFLRSRDQLLKAGFKTVQHWWATDTRDRTDLPRRIIKPGAVGCLISHRELLLHARQNEMPYLYVFEDDIIVHDGFDPNGPDCDILYYGASQLQWTDEMIGPMYRANRTLGTFAMRIKASVYDALIDALYTTDATVDNTIAERIQPHWDCRVVFPNTVTAHVTNSSIRERVNPEVWERKCRWPKPKKRDFLENVTFGVVSFNRFSHLEKCVNSLPHGCKVIIADNSTIGRPNVPHVALEPDCGASACRNYLMENAKTEYLMLVDDDTYLTDSVEPFFDFLEAEPGHACIGGSLRLPDNTVMHSGLRLENNEFSGASWQVTNGLVWKPCDMVFDFCMLRRGCGLWDSNIKIGGEHRKFFEGIIGKVAYTPQVEAYHDITGRSAEYMAFRNRGNGRAVAWDFGVYRHNIDKPNLLVFGVGHSGTTILTKMLMGLGWSSPRADAEFAEDTVVRHWNQEFLRGRDPGAALLELPRPWVIKDPRFVATLEHWYEAFSKNNVAMVYITKDSIEDSYLRRGERLDKSHGGHSVQELQALAEEKYRKWPWAKVKVRYENLASVIKLWRAL